MNAGEAPGDDQCVVCGARLGGERHFANAWERARKLSACCSAHCASSFDEDVHWLPSRQPQCLDAPEERRLAEVLRARLAAGDRSALAAREALVAGVALERVRFELEKAGAFARAADGEVARKIGVGFLRGLLGGSFTAAARTAGPEVADVDAAAAVLSAWSARFPGAHPD